MNKDLIIGAIVALSLGGAYVAKKEIKKNKDAARVEGCTMLASVALSNPMVTYTCLSRNGKLVIRGEDIKGRIAYFDVETGNPLDGFKE